MTELINLTPYPIRIYAFDTPDRIADLATGLRLTIPPDGRVARVGEMSMGTDRTLTLDDDHGGFVSVPVEYVEHRYTVNLPDPEDGVWFVVSLVLALSPEVGSRSDLLTPYSLVRNTEGTVVGCRTLARPC